MFRNKFAVIVLAVFVFACNMISFIPAVSAATSTVTNQVEVSTGKKVLFDNTHGQTAGAADWVIDGAFSDFADGLKADGFTVEQLDRQIPYTFGEQAITYDKLKNYDVFIIGEANIPYKQSEQDAMLQYVQNGGSIFFIADHYNADRNKNRWDASEVMNGYRRGAYTNPAKGMTSDEANSPAMQGVSSSDWLGSNFGIRFRYNAIGDVNATDIVTADQSFGITKGISAVAMHAGSTLAILDPQKAKGIVYIPTGVPSWSSAVDQGVYNGGGRAEGAFAAISKVGQGKAAFIGDSSPVEDATPKYLREENGKAKTTYDGFKEVNDGKFLVQTVEWLSQKESYTNLTEVPGLQLDQPTKLLPMEDPASSTEPQSEPWAAPDPGYKWYDPSTFKPGSYGSTTQPSTNPVYKFVHQATLPSQQEFKIRVTADNLLPGQSQTSLKAGIYLASGEQIAQFQNADGTWSAYGYSPDLTLTADATGHASKELTVKIKPGKQGAANLRLKQGTNNVITESVNIANVPAEELPGDTIPVPAPTSILAARQAADNTLVTIEGVITSEPGGFGGQGFYLQDDAAGIYVYQNTAGFHKGDRISISAVKTTFNGEVELSDPVVLKKIGTSTLPKPEVQGAVTNENQGRLIKIENVVIHNVVSAAPAGSFEFDAVGQYGTTHVRVDGRTGISQSAFQQQYPEGSSVNITGISSIFKGMYQLKPLEFANFELADTTAPVTTAVVDGVSGENQYNTKDVTVTFTASDDNGSGVAKTEYQVDGGEWTLVNGPVTISDEGKHTLAYRSVDKAGNTEEAKTLPIWIDKQAPVTNAVVDGVSGENQYNTKDVTVTFTASDDNGSGVAKTEYQVDGGEWTLVNGSVTISDEGKHSLAYRSVDKAGNIEEAKTLPIWIDKQAPVTNAVVDGVSGENQYNTRDVTVTFTANDNGSGLEKTEYRLDGGDWITVAGQVILSEEGKYSLDYRSIDKAGNVENSKTLPIWIDKQAPTITMEGATSFYQTDAKVPVTVKVEDALSGVKTVQYTLDGRVIDSLDTVSPLSLLVGSHVFTVNVEDYAGNKTSQTFTLENKIDISHLSELLSIGFNNNDIQKQGTVSSLQAKIEGIKEAPTKQAQQNKLQALENEVRAQLGKSISSRFALLLLSDIQNIRTQL
ncbi:OmpL47-type beta-barrel domain-containing protein [Ectobacillus polymachus]|uniref:OmpL47-type beta-barrel domain-containing protein n=1 Tax=Ectobacillus polymachus TaxID=1508806 RepID=UPI003A840BE1